MLYQYNNTSKYLIRLENNGFEVEYSADGGAIVSYDLPRESKDIVVTKWYDDSLRRKTLRWNRRWLEY